MGVPVQRLVRGRWWRRAPAVRRCRHGSPHVGLRMWVSASRGPFDGGVVKFHSCLADRADAGAGEFVQSLRQV